MRLAQLARKISRTQSEILEMFSQHGISEYDNLNSKISKEHLELAFKKFAPQFLDEENIPDETGTEKDEKVPDEGRRKIVAESEKDKGDLISGQSDENASRDDTESTIEKITIPKPKLEGVKVVGKIDLPEPRSKAGTEENQEKVEEEESKKTKSSRPKTSKSTKTNSDHRKGSRPGSNRRKNTGKEKISYREKVRKEEQKREKLKREKKKKEKEKKRKHYVKRVQSNIQQKTSKKSDSRKRQLYNDETGKPETPRYKNPLRRFWAWLNGKYDR